MVQYHIYKCDESNRCGFFTQINKQKHLLRHKHNAPKELPSRKPKHPHLFARSVRSIRLIHTTENSPLNSQQATIYMTNAKNKLHKTEFQNERRRTCRVFHTNNIYKMKRVYTYIVGGDQNHLKQNINIKHDTRRDESTHTHDDARCFFFCLFGGGSMATYCNRAPTITITPVKRNHTSNNKHKHVSYIVSLASKRLV